MSSEAKVGTFVIASLLVLGAAFYFVRTSRSVKGQVPYKTYLRYAGGLAPGADVLFGGIKVGQVTGVHPSSQDPTEIEILFDVKAGTPINHNSTARVGSVSLMASPALSITTGTNEAARLRAWDVVPSQESLSPDDVMRRAGALADNANALVTQLKAEIPALTGEARMVLANLNQISGRENQERIAGILAEVNTILNRESPKIAKITDQLSGLTKEANSLLVSAKPVVGNIDATVTNVDKTVDALREPLARDLAEMERTIKQAQALLANVQSVVQTNQPDIAETMENLRSTSENLRVLSESLKQRPWSLIRIKEPPDRSVPP